MAELVRGMEPEEVAQNLELFDSMDSMFEYAGSLNARDARKFMNNLSDKDKVIFDGELPDIESTLGPREVRGDFAEGGSMLVPPERAMYSEGQEVSDEEVFRNFLEERDAGKEVIRNKSHLSESQQNN